jgi:DNA-binding Lrp family transcriptional regulator
MERDFKGVWIPKEIWLDDRLNALDKVILTEIDSLDMSERGCYASNRHIAEFCQCSETKVSTAISKLVKLGYLYVKSFDGRQRELKSRLSKFERQDYKNCEADFKNLKQSNTYNNTNNNSFNNTSIYQEKKKPASMDDMMRYEELIKSNIDYDILIQYENKAEVDELVSIMVELCCSSADTVIIGKEEKSTEIVKSQMLKIDSEHIKYVLNSIKDNRTEIKNIKAYLKSCLFNAPQTIGNYYTALVSADMGGW